MARRLRTIDDMLRDHLLAGLRLLQEAIIEDRLPEDVAEIAINANMHSLASAEMIDQWCEDLNRPT
jgi:hypothetical protein